MVKTIAERARIYYVILTLSDESIRYITAKGKAYPVTLDEARVFRGMIGKYGYGKTRDINREEIFNLKEILEELNCTNIRLIKSVRTTTNDNFL